MENQLLKKSGIIAAIVTFALIGAWFGFSKISLGLDTSNWTPYAMKKNSVVSEQLIIMCGTSGSGIVFGTTSGAWVGTPTDSTLARVFFNTATGRLEFKPSGTTTSFPFGSVTVAYLDANYATIGSVSAKLDAVGGVGTSNTFNNATLAGLGSITATFRANGLDITPAEYSCVDGGTSPFQGQINAKQDSIGQTPLGSSVGSVTTALGSQSINTFNDVNIIFNENDFVKIVGGQLVAGSSTVTVAFSEVTGSATASQLPPISGLLGSATASQLPTVYRLYGTTTNQAAGTFGQLYVQSISGISTTGTVTGFGTLTAASLVSYYRLEDLIDSFGVNDLTNYGTTTFVVGKYGNCATFNGTTQYLQTSLLSTATTNVSMFGWVYIASTSEARPFFTNGVDSDSGTNGYALGVGGAGYYQVGNNLVGLLPSVANLGFATAIGTGWHHVGMTRDSTTWRGYIDGVVCATTFTNEPLTPTGNFTIGRGANSGWKYYNDKIDDVVFYNKCLSAGEIIELYNNTGAGGAVGCIQYSTKYADPVNGNTVFEILTPGTVTAQASYIYCNATTTVFGLGTNTAIVATATAYSGWFAGAVRATAFNVASTEKIKENIKPIKIKPDFLDAEGLAKQNYIASAKVAWIAANQASYTTIASETGTGSVTVIDIPAMETAYNNYIELAWATDLNQDSYVKNIQKTYEKGFWQMFDSVTPRSWNPKDKPTLTRKGFVVEDMPDVMKGDDGQSIDPMALIAYISVVQQTLKADTIFALNTLKELITIGTVTQQKIDYVQDRLEVLNP